LSVFIWFWRFIPFWNQETNQITMGVNSRQLGQVRFSPKGNAAGFVLFNLRYAQTFWILKVNKKIWPVEIGTNSVTTNTYFQELVLHSCYINSSTSITLYCTNALSVVFSRMYCHSSYLIIRCLFVHSVHTNRLILLGGTSAVH